MTSLTPVLGFTLPGDNDPMDELVLAGNWIQADGIPGVAPLTQAQIGALTAAQKPAGRPVYNTTIGALQIWDGAAWRTAMQTPGAPTPVALALDVARQPNANRPTYVNVTLQTGSSGGTLQILMDANNPPTTVLAQINPGASSGAPFAFIVPAGLFYKLHNTGTAGSVAFGPVEETL